MIRNLLFFLLIVLPQFAFAGGGVGNGGDGVFCTWRSPLALDFYEASSGKYSPLVDLYNSPLTAPELAVELLEKRHREFGFMLPVTDLIKQLRKGIRRHADYRKWEKVPSLPKIEDSWHDIFLPAGCEIKQVAQFKGNKIRVVGELFSQMDQRQQEMLALHEALYWVGRKYYKHTNSYLTRRLIRSLLQIEDDGYMGVFEFITNSVPSDLRTLNENIPGSSAFYRWRSNVFDLQGDFVRTKGQLCPETISFTSRTDAKFTLWLRTARQEYRVTQENLRFLPEISTLQDYMRLGVIKPAFLEELSLGKDDRFMPLLHEEADVLFLMGLNRKDELVFFPMIFSRAFRETCVYTRTLKLMTDQNRN